MVAIIVARGREGGSFRLEVKVKSLLINRYQEDIKKIEVFGNSKWKV